MKTKLSLWFLLGIVTIATHAQNSVFTYQGQLSDNGSPANGIFDFQFGLLNAPTNGSLVAQTITNSAVPVSNGLFQVALDFGSSPFNGSDRWLAISVRSHGGPGTFTALLPPQPIARLPYAIYADKSGVAGAATSLLDGGASLTIVPAASLNGIINASLLPGTLANWALLIPNEKQNALGYLPATNSFAGITNALGFAPATNGLFSGNGTALLVASSNIVGAIPASALSGTIVDGRLSLNLQGWSALSTSAKQNALGFVPVTNNFAGIASALGFAPATNGLFSGDGTALVVASSNIVGAIPASTLSGTIADARLSSNLQGWSALSTSAKQNALGFAPATNSFFGITSALGYAPATNGVFSGDGTALVVASSNIVGAIPSSTLSGTIADARLSSNLQGWSALSTSAKQNALGYVPATNSHGGLIAALGYTPATNGVVSGDGTALVVASSNIVGAIPASTLSGTIADARLSSNLQGWSALSTSAKQNALGYVPATNSQGGIIDALGYTPATNGVVSGDGTALVVASSNIVGAIPASTLSGTIADVRLSSNLQGWSALSTSAKQNALGYVPATNNQGGIIGALGYTPATNGVVSGDGTALVVASSNIVGAIPASTLSGTIVDARLSSTLQGWSTILPSAKQNALGYVPATNSYAGVASALGYAPATNGVFSGDGTALVVASSNIVGWIPASTLSGTIVDARLSSNLQGWSTLPTNAKQNALGYVPATNSFGGIASALGYAPATNGLYSGDGTALLVASSNIVGSIPASALSGTVADGRLSPNLQGWSAISTSAKQNALGYVPATNSFAGITGALGYAPATNGLYSGDGTALLVASSNIVGSIPATTLSGTIADARLSANLQGWSALSTSAKQNALGYVPSTNSFSGITSALGYTPATNGIVSGDGTALVVASSNIVGLIPANTLSGTIADARLSANLQGWSALSTSTKQNALGYVPATNNFSGITNALGYAPATNGIFGGDGTALVVASSNIVGSIPASTLSGTIDDTRLSSNLQGWSGISTSAKQNTLGYVPATNSFAGITTALGYVPETNGAVNSTWQSDINGAGYAATNVSSIRLESSSPMVSMRTSGTNNTDLDAALKLRNLGGLPAAVPYFVPTSTNANARIALDLVVKGNPVDRGSAGVAWIDVTDSNEAELDSGNFEAIRVSKFMNGNGQVSMTAAGSGSVRDLILQYNGGRVGVGTTNIAANYPGNAKLVLVGASALLAAGFSDSVPAFSLTGAADGTFTMSDWASGAFVGGIKQSNGVVYMPKLVVSPAASVPTNQAPLQVSAPPVTIDSWATNSLSGRAMYIFQLAATAGVSDPVNVQILVDDNLDGTWDYSASWGQPANAVGTFTNTFTLPMSAGARFTVTNYSGPGATVSLVGVNRLGM